MRKKCLICNSCMGGAWYENRLYYYCTLCRKVHGLVGRELVLIEDNIIELHFRDLYGTIV